MIIDCHAHLVPPSLLDAVRAQAQNFPSIRQIEDGGSLGFSFAGGKPTRPVSKPLSDLPARLKWMDEQKIERQVVGGWLDMFGYEVPAEEGANWSRLINTHLAQTAMREPRFVPLATVPLQDGVRAAEVLREAHASGFRGAMITQPKGRGGVLDDPSLEPFWEAANELGSVVFIHPVFESGDDRVHDYGMANAVGRVTDTLIAMSRLIYAGHVTRYAGAKIVAGIGGAALPYVIGRLRRNYSLDSDKLGDPDAALAAMYYDTIVQDPRALRYLADIVGADRIMMGSDMPFPIGDLAPTRIVAEAKFSDAERAAINGGLAQKLFGRERDQPMKLDIGGVERIQVPVEALWKALNDPVVLTRCIPGCKTMTLIGPDAYKVELQLRVAAVGGSFEGEIALSDKQPPKACSIKVSGAGTLGHGNGSARFEIAPEGPDASSLSFQGAGEIGGLVAGVGQRILGSVSRHLVGRFFVALRKEVETPVEGAAE